MSEVTVQRKRPTKKEREAARLRKQEEQARAYEVRQEAERKRQAERQAVLDKEFLDRMARVLGRTPTDKDRAAYKDDNDLVIALVLGRAPTDEDRRIYREFVHVGHVGEQDYVESWIKRST